MDCSHCPACSHTQPGGTARTVARTVAVRVECAADCPRLRVVSTVVSVRTVESHAGSSVMREVDGMDRQGLI